MELASHFAGLAVGGGMNNMSAGNRLKSVSRSAAIAAPVVDFPQHQRVCRRPRKTQHDASMKPESRAGGHESARASPDCLSHTEVCVRCPQKRSQRFTVPVQPPNPAASPPFSNSPSDDSGPTTGTGSGSSFALSNTASSHSDHHLLSNGHHSYPYSNEALFPAPANFAQTGPSSSLLSGNQGSNGSNNNTNGHVEHAFLQQDPFAFPPPSNRSRTLSSGSSNGGQHHTHHQHTGSLSANGIWAEQPSQQQQQQHQQSNQQGYQQHQQRNSGPFEPFNGNNNPRSSPFNQPGFLPHQQPQQSQQQPSSRQQFNNGQNAASSAPGPDFGADDVIPTAIVIKNIPFNFPSTSLMQIIEELTLAPPYAFNYHYDMGVFRGLAFANFHTPQETDSCVAALNGFEIQGRKLRVEYKKVLQAGEKERIERDKAIKRMRSMQLDRERMIQQQQAHVQQLQQQIFGQQQQQGQGPMQHQQPGQMQHPMHLQQQMQANHQHQHSHDDFEDYGRAVHPSNSMFNQPHSMMGGTFSPPMENTDSYPSQSHSGSGASNSSRTHSGNSMPTELDMNDSQTLELYSRVLLFKEDALRDELAFSKALSNVQRRIVHLIAQKLSLQHRSAGSGEDKCVIVSKSGSNGTQHPQSQPHQQQRTIRTRASAYPMLNPDPYAPPQPSLLPDGMGMHAFNNALRKKSMPDLRHQQQHPLYSNLAYQQHQPQSQSPTLSGASTHSNITPRHSTHDLRAVAASANNRRSMYMHTSAPGENNNIPPVPALPSNLMQNTRSNGSLQTMNTPMPISAPPTNSNNSDRHSIIFGSGSVDLNSDGMPKVATSLPTSTLSLDSKIVGSPVTPIAPASTAAGGVVRQPRGPDNATSWTRGSTAMSSATM